MSDDVTCRNCLYWQPALSGPLGRCRRYAPSDRSPVWPETDAEDWCGDFDHNGLPIPRPDPN